MKKSVRLFISGSLQHMFFSRFIKDNADSLGIRGFVRKTEEGKVEVFLEGDSAVLNQMIALCKRGPQHSIVRTVEQKEEKFQDFKEFRIIKI